MHKTTSSNQVIKALTIVQPYATLIMQGIKQYEMRNWLPRAASTFFVHAGLTPLSTATMLNTGMDTAYWDNVHLPLGALLGVVKATEVIPTKHLDLTMWNCGLHPIEFKYAWKLEVLEVFKEPIPMRGNLGFWSVSTSAINPKG